MKGEMKKPGGLLVAIGMGKGKPMADGEEMGEMGDDYEHDEGSLELAGEVRKAVHGDDDNEVARALCNFIDNHLAMKRARKMAQEDEE